MSHVPATLRADDVASEVLVARFQAKLRLLPGSDCLWWTGAISRNAGHGRFWLGTGRVVVAHRFAFALAEGLDALVGVEVLAHACDNPLCQRIGAGHVVASTRAQNQIDWVARGGVSAGNYIGPDSSYDRSLVMRNLLLLDPGVAARHLASLPHRHGVQLPLW